MTVTVFGASGRVGRLVAENLLAAGHEVVAFVHSSSPFEANPRLKIARGDIHNAADVAAAIQGSQAVISTLGSWGTKAKDIVSSGVANIIPAMQAGGVARLITLTGADARAKGDHLGVLHRFTHWVIGLTPARNILADGERQIALLEQSDLNWTSVRSAVMRRWGSRAYRLTVRRPLPWASVHRAAVATCLVSLLTDAQHSCQAPFIAAA